MVKILRKFSCISFLFKPPWFYLHLWIGLIRCNKYCGAAKKLVPVLIGVIQVKVFYKIFTKIQTTEERFNFLRTSEIGLRENLDFRGLCVNLSYVLLFSDLIFVAESY